MNPAGGLIPMGTLALAIGACVTVGSGADVEPRTVLIEVENTQVRAGEVAVSLYSQGQYTRLGTVAPRSSVTFALEIHRPGLYRMLAFRPGPTPNPSHDSSRPPGQLVASTDGFSLSVDSEHVYWDLSSRFVRLTP